MVELKLGRLRKPQKFAVTQDGEEHILIQSDKSIGRFNSRTGDGRLCIRGNRFISLSVDSTLYQMKPDDLQACLAELEGQ